MAVDVRMINASGIGTYISNLLPLIIESNPEIHFYLLGDSSSIERKQWNLSNISVIKMQSPIYSIAEQKEFTRKIPKDINLFWSPHFNIPLFYRGKLIVTIHDLFHLANPKFTTVPQRIYAKIFFNALRKKADKIMFVSEFSRSEYTKYLGASSKDCVTHIGVDSSWLHFTKLGKCNNKPFILYVGNVKPHKNLMSLLSAYERIADKVIHDLIIVGKKEGFITGDTQVSKKAEMLGERVKFTGYIEESTLKNYFSNADLLVFPSFYEGFGLPPLEAMAVGCPTVVSTAASIPEVCADASLYFDPHDAGSIAEKILLVLNDNEIRGELILKGKERAALFTWEKCAAKTNELIRGVLEQ
ncbi:MULTISPECIES: glycosyltransferase family 4 protein [Paenibacillus]|uniref:glycosyltransferase family 4 protein n=1 Tax=Paenibacillus TaxID=44249 RepID=UPI0022B8B2B2|nr:glycosyltransferase family 1 protein [Paenibacillus caseinilyticus]MCZ8523112.1 glycosyltransferase family 1 protein [Paenibacillus caseinilyticus]